MGLWPTADLNAMSIASGVTSFTAAFVVQEVNRPCVPAWGAYAAYEVGGTGDFLPNISRFQQAGGQVIVSFGGALNNELAETCTSDASLLAAYKSVVARYSVSRIDFDIEGTAVSNATGNQRRARVVAQLQKDLAASGKPLQVSLTLPVMPYGLIASGIRTVKEFADAGVDVAAVNVMAMDYGAGYTAMGTSAVTAAQNTAAQLTKIAQYSTLTDAQALAKVGVTPMIGQNDLAGEIFTPTDATTVATFAKANGIGMIAWWEMTRDRPCTATITATYLCSQVSAPQWAFSKAFLAGL
jgi:hypothetical protein